MKTHALAYVLARGWSVFPLHELVRTADGQVCSCGRSTCKPGKHPRTAKGVDDATTSPEQVEQWWTRWPTANIGVACGTSGLFVVDLDGPAAVEAWRGLLEQHGRADTLTSRTARGWHLVYRQPAAPLSNSAGKLAAGIDTRGTGGYIVAPPSVHQSGHVYAWHDQGADVAPCPAWLEQLLRPAPRELGPRPVAPALEQVTDVRRHKYLTSAVRGELQRVMDAVEGTRNDTLCRAAFSLGQLVGDGALDEDAVTDALMAAAGAVGLDDREAATTIRSGLRAGASKPRSATA